MASRWEQTGLPKWDVLMWVTLEALREIPMPVTVDAVAAAVSDRLQLSTEQRAVPSHNPKWNYIRFQVGFVVSDLKGVGALEQPRRGLYDLTDDGRHISHETVRQRHARRGEQLRERKRLRQESEDNGIDQTRADSSVDGDFPNSAPPPWNEELSERLMNISPTAFEHLSASLLRVAGFDDVEVTGRTGDGGIDGIGVYRPSGLISFHTAFQCKRYQGSVGAGTVRDFRGSFVGRADRGIILTTGYFTRAARDEASRPGANPVDLIDGEALCDLLREHSLGVRTTKRVVEDVIVDDAYFDQFEDSP